MSAIGNREYRAKVLENTQFDQLLQGAIDMHYHGYPEISFKIKARMEDVKLLTLARDMGMRGIVIKSQMWPSTATVYHLTQRVPGIECFASITLNSIAGGLSPMAVEAASGQGAKVIWMPTWSSSHKLGKGGFATMMRTWFPAIQREPGLNCLDASGNLKGEVLEIIRLAKDLNMVLCTGHISPQESLALARECRRIDFAQLIFTHPLSKSVDADFEEMKAMAAQGAYIEICALNIFYGNDLEKAIHIIKEFGADHCVLSTDAFGEYVPAQPEFLRMLMAYLLISGVSEAEIRTMICDNPTTLLMLSKG